jgi:hypothetical protein
MQKPEKHPCNLAEAVFGLLGDVDFNTAQSALRIAMVLNEHREISLGLLDSSKTISRAC